MSVFSLYISFLLDYFNVFLFDKNLTKEALESLGNRPFLIFHGTEDTRVPFFHSEQLGKYVKSFGGKITFFPLEGADHTEGVLSHSEVYEDNLPKFFKANLL